MPTKDILPPRSAVGCRAPSSDMENEPIHRVTAIEPQVRRPERRSVFLDGEFALGADVEVIARAGIQVGQGLTHAELEALVRAEERRSARDAALRFLGFRERSAREIERHLLRKGYEAEVVSEVIGDLSSRDYVNDARFAHAWVESHTASRPVGPDRLAAALRARGVEPETVREAVSEIDPTTELELALRAGERLVGGVNRQDPRQARRRLAAALRRRGFSWDVIRPACDRLLGDGESDGADGCES
jgi:regulatory protein